MILYENKKKVAIARNLFYCQFELVIRHPVRDA